MLLPLTSDKKRQQMTLNCRLKSNEDASNVIDVMAT